MPTLMLVPTGIGCDIGGYAGDALPSARLLAAASGCLITHPNVMNGASLYWSDSRVLYVEGYGLDRFAVGDWALRPVRRQRIGLLLDAGIEPELAQRQIQVAEGCRASLGLEIGPVVSTDTPLEVTLECGASGASWGRLGCPVVCALCVTYVRNMCEPGRCGVMCGCFFPKLIVYNNIGPSYIFCEPD